MAAAGFGSSPRFREGRDMTNEELLALVESQAQTIAAIQARLGPVEEPPLAPGVFREFPRVMYRRDEDTKGHADGQVDHPGNDTLVVKSAAEMEAALVDGWQTDPHEFDYAKPVPKKAAGKK